MENYMICDECGEKMLPEIVEQNFHFDGKEIALTGLEAYKCPRCGNIVYSAEQAEMIDKLVREVTFETTSRSKFDCIVA